MIKVLDHRIRYVGSCFRTMYESGKHAYIHHNARNLKTKEGKPYKVTKFRGHLETKPKGEFVEIDKIFGDEMECKELEEAYINQGIEQDLDLLNDIEHELGRYPSRAPLMTDSWDTLSPDHPGFRWVIYGWIEYE